MTLGLTHLGSQMEYYVFSAPRLLLPLSHQPWESDSLAFVHVCVILSHKGALSLEGSDHCAALEGLGHMGTHA